MLIKSYNNVGDHQNNKNDYAAEKVNGDRKSKQNNVTGFWKTVPNHTFLFSYIYHCHMEFNAQITKL